MGDSLHGRVGQIVGISAYRPNKELVGQRLRRRTTNAYRRFEHHEEVFVVVSIDRLTIVAEIDRAVDAAEPLARDALHAVVAQRRVVVQGSEVRLRVVRVVREPSSRPCRRFVEDGDDGLRGLDLFVHRPRELEEDVHTVMEEIGARFAVCALKKNHVRPFPSLKTFEFLLNCTQTTLSMDRLHTDT